MQGVDCGDPQDSKGCLVDQRPHSDSHDAGSSSWLLRADMIVTEHTLRRLVMMNDMMGGGAMMWGMGAIGLLALIVLVLLLVALVKYIFFQ